MPRSLLLAALAIAVVFPPAAAGAPPGNDDFDDAVVISSLPFSHTVDTREATGPADDPNCVGRGATVWYSFTPASDVIVAANTFGSNYDTTLSVYTGSSGALTQITCNDDAVDGLQSRLAFAAQAGVTYHIMAGSWNSGPGGDLHLLVEEAEPPQASVTLDPTGWVLPFVGWAVVKGTYRCSNELDNADLEGELEQNLPGGTVSGDFAQGPDCDGLPHSWDAIVLPENGRFARGRVNVFVSLEACLPPNLCATDSEQRQVLLFGLR
jgi:hypothetical protein